MVKITLMETKIIAQSALVCMLKKENVVTQESQKHVDLLDLEEEVHVDYLMMIPSAILVNTVKMVNLVGLDNLEKMVHLENPAMMATLEMKMI